MLKMVSQLSIGIQRPSWFIGKVSLTIFKFLTIVVHNLSQSFIIPARLRFIFTLLFLGLVHPSTEGFGNVDLFLRLGVPSTHLPVTKPELSVANALQTEGI